MFSCSTLSPQTHTPPPELMHSYCPHLLFLLTSSSRYHFITVCLCCSAACLASPSLICPVHFYFIPFSLSLPDPNSVFFLPTSSFSSPSGWLAEAHIPPTTFRSPTAKDFKVFRFLSGGFLERQMCVRKSSWFQRSVCHSRPSSLTPLDQYSLRSQPVYSRAGTTMKHK